MAIVGMKLVSHCGTFEIDKAEFTLEWVVFSTNQRDYTLAIALQGTIPPERDMDENGEAVGWYDPGVPYRLGNEWHNTCYAGNLAITNRTIIGGRGDFEIICNAYGITVERIWNRNPAVAYTFPD